MRRPFRDILVISMLVCALAGCANSGVESYKRADPHVVAMYNELAAAEVNDNMKAANVDMNSDSASETVERVIAQCVERTRSARRELKSAQAEVALAPDSPTKQKWVSALSEFSQALDAHGRLLARGSGFYRQLVVTGMCEKEIPASDGDLAGAWAFGAAGGVDSETLVQVGSIASKNFSRLSSDLARAQALEPAAGLQSWQQYCARRQKIADLLVAAGSAGKRGDRRKQNELIAQARRLDAALNKDAPKLLAKPPLLSDGYAAQIESSAISDEHGHLVKTVAALKELGFKM